MGFSAPLGEKEQEIYNKLSATDEPSAYNSSDDSPYEASSSLVLSAKDHEKEYFVGQVFSIDLEARTSESGTLFEFRVDFEKSKDLEFLNPNLKWQKNGDSYTTTLFFEARSVNANLDKIIVSMTRNKEAFQSASLTLNPIEFKRVDADKNYSQLVASKLEVTRFRTSYFDDKNLVMIVALRAQDANLRDFKLKDSTLLQQRIDNVQGDFKNASAFFSAVFAPSKQNVEFSYFNTTTQKLENFSLKVEVSADESISTQTDLNPKNNDLNFYKQLGLWVLAGICALVFVFRRNYIFFGAALILFALSFLVDTTTHTATLKANSRAKLLPTTNSTYFYTSKDAEKVEILGKREDYVKVLFEDGKIGWVLKNDLQD